MANQLNHSGFVIAGIGFFLTRFTVALAIYEEPIPFYVGGIVPLVLGLGLAAFGVALVVADVDPALVRTTATWCVIGAGTMLILVLLTLAASNPGDFLELETIQSQTYLSNFLIGGSVGGTFTGLYAANNRHQRTELRNQANRLEVLNRLLRHEVLNAVTVIKGYASLETNRDAETWDIVEDRSEAIEHTIEEVGYLAQDASQTRKSTQPIDLADCLYASLEVIEEEYPKSQVRVGTVPEALTVTATDRFDRVFIHLLEQAILHSTADEPVVKVSISTSSNRVEVRIQYNGTPLEANQRALLERGEIDRYDDPSMGFSLNVVRLLVENYRGSIDIDSRSDGETIIVDLPRGIADRPGSQSTPSGLYGTIPTWPNLIVSLVAALIAGVAYGIVSEILGGSVAGIGVFYGTVSPVVGWVTHEFHSIVFGFVYLGLVSNAPDRFRKSLVGYLIIGIGWAMVVWTIAAGIVAPIWLQLLGIPVPIPSFSSDLLLSHLAWGITLALALWWGQKKISTLFNQSSD